MGEEVADQAPEEAPHIVVDLEEVGPRFANQGSFEFEYGEKWKQLFEMKKQKLEALDREMNLEEDKLIAQMEFARYEHETEALRRQLAEREQGRSMNKQMWEQKEMEMARNFDQEATRQQQEEKMMMEKMQRQEESMMRKQQENNIFMQEQGGMGMGGPMGGPMGPMGGGPMRGRGGMMRGGRGGAPPMGGNRGMSEEMDFGMGGGRGGPRGGMMRG